MGGRLRRMGQGRVWSKRPRTDAGGPCCDASPMRSSATASRSRGCSTSRRAIALATRHVPRSRRCSTCCGSSRARLRAQGPHAAVGGRPALLYDVRSARRRGAIIPWNAPLFLMAAKLGPSLVAGNTIVMKTAEQAPLAVLRAIEIMQDILPPASPTSSRASGPRRQAAGRTSARAQGRLPPGSGAVGKEILRYAADKLCPVTLELGGRGRTSSCPMPISTSSSRA